MPTEWSLAVSILLHCAFRLPDTRSSSPLQAWLAQTHASALKLSAGLMIGAKQAEAPGSEIAAGFFEELLEMPAAGQTLFRVAAAELEQAVAALADAGRCGLHHFFLDYLGIPA